MTEKDTLGSGRRPSDVPEAQSDSVACPRSAWSGGEDVGLKDLCVSFMRIGLLGFGGVAPVARHELVERRRWLTDREYAAVLGLNKVLPGANTVNAAVMIGDRFQGALGAVLAVFALMAAPLAIAVLLTLGYAEVSSAPMAQAMMAGAAAAAAGLVIGTAMRMARGVRQSPFAVVFGGAALIAVGVLDIPLVTAVLVIGPIAVATAALRRLRR